jgi:hypothetical protein
MRDLLRARARRSETGLLKSLDLVEVDGKQYWLVDKHKRDGRWYKRLLPVVGGGGLGFQDAPMVLIQDGPALNTFTTAKSVFGATGTDAATAAKYTAAPGFFYIGKALRIVAIGDLSNIVTSPGTITFQFMVGSVIAWTSGAINFSTTVHTALPFWLDIMLTCQTIGTTAQAKLMGQGQIISQCVSNTQIADAVTSSLPTLLLPNTTPAQGTGFDSAVSNQFDLFAGFSVSNVGNQVRIRQFALSALN